LRPAIVAACAPLVSDAVICGQDKAYIGALIWPSPVALKSAIDAAGGDRAAALANLTQRVGEKISAFNSAQSGSSRRIGKFSLLATPPSLDAGEITDTGYISQRRALDVRAADVAHLFD
jgi:feruloyl-CoA synthase